MRAALLPGSHRDPFDRMLVAQAQAENIPIFSNEVIFDRYGVRRIWKFRSGHTNGQPRPPFI